MIHDNIYETNMKTLKLTFIYVQQTQEKITILKNDNSFNVEIITSNPIVISQTINSAFSFEYIGLKIISQVGGNILLMPLFYNNNYVKKISIDTSCCKSTITSFNWCENCPNLECLDLHLFIWDSFYIDYNHHIGTNKLAQRFNLDNSLKLKTICLDGWSELNIDLFLKLCFKNNTPAANIIQHMLNTISKKKMICKINEQSKIISAIPYLVFSYEREVNDLKKFLKGNLEPEIVEIKETKKEYPELFKWIQQDYGNNSEEMNQLITEYQIKTADVKQTIKEEFNNFMDTRIQGLINLQKYMSKVLDDIEDDYIFTNHFIYFSYIDFTDSD